MIPRDAAHATDVPLWQGAPRGAFCWHGRFSNTNNAVETLLRDHLPEISWKSLDVGRLDRPGPLQMGRIALETLQTYGMHGNSWQRFAKRTRRSSAHLKYTTRRIRQALGSTPLALTFQTQSIFDGSVPGVPHFLYTDHTHLANLYYPSFRSQDLLSKKWVACERSIYERATVIFTMSSHVSRSLVEHYGCDPQKVVCAYAGPNVPCPAEPMRDAAERGKKRILFVGKAWDRKGGPQLLKAFELVLRRHPDVSLTILGCTPRVHLPHCTVIGRVPLSDVHRHFQEATIFCMPTRIEPFGLVFVEAMAHRLPIVASNVGALPDLVSDGYNGYLVEPDDVEGLAARLIELLAHPELCETFGQHGWRRAEQQYNWANTGRIIAEQIRSRVPLPPQL